MKRAKVIGTVGFMLVGLVGAAPVQAHTTGVHDNCTKLNQKWPHGVGRRDAIDQGGNVTNFKRSNRLYRRAISHNPPWTGTKTRSLAKKLEARDL